MLQIYSTLFLPQKRLPKPRVHKADSNVTFTYLPGPAPASDDHLCARPWLRRPSGGQLHRCDRGAEHKGGGHLDEGCVEYDVVEVGMHRDGLNPLERAAGLAEGGAGTDPPPGHAGVPVCGHIRSQHAMGNGFDITE